MFIFFFLKFKAHDKKHEWSNSKKIFFVIRKKRNFRIRWFEKSQALLRNDNICSIVSSILCLFCFFFLSEHWMQYCLSVFYKKKKILFVRYCWTYVTRNIIIVNFAGIGCHSKASWIYLNDKNLGSDLRFVNNMHVKKILHPQPLYELWWKEWADSSKKFMFLFWLS